MTITIDNIQTYPQYEQASIMVCPTDAYETEEATWQGVRLADLFQAAGLQPEARAFVVRSDFDNYRQRFKLSELAETEIFLAITKENRPMTFDEGGPARLVVPDAGGYRWVRWVNSIEVTD